MIKFTKLLDKVVVKKAYGYRFHSFRAGKNSIFRSKEIERIDFCVANNLLNNMILKTDEDFALAFASLNLIGANAKQNKHLLGANNNSAYEQRRQHLYGIIASAINQNVDIKINSVCDEYTGNKVTIVSLGNIQFTYHIDCESVIEYFKSNEINLVDEALRWDQNFRMQNGGKELFEFCLHLKNVSATLTGERPLDYVRFLREEYYQNED
ncbi:MAG: hypothetical protein ACI4TI_03845, partial [Christensenellales bacterium]